MNKIITIAIAVAIVVGGGSFYAGMKYARSQTPQRGGGGNFANLSPEERQQRLQELGAPLRQGFEGQANAGGFRGRRTGGQMNDGFTSGEIISKDDPEGEQAPYGASKNVTIKIPNGSSRIIFFSASTEINKSTQGTIDDLEIGKNIAINGTANPDGSITADTIQLRPRTNRGQP